MNAIEASGAPRDIGRALGAAGKTAIAEAAFSTPQFHALSQWLGSARLENILAAATRHFPQFVEEIKGIAEGAEQPFEKIFLWNCRGDLRDLARSDDEGCTTLLLPKSDLHPATIGHNEDGSPSFEGRGFVVKAKPDDGPAFEAFCYPGMLPGHAFAMNARGIVQTINNIRPHDLTVGLPRHIVTRAILACDTMEEVLALTKRPDRASGFHHALGEARSETLYSVEAPATGCVAKKVENPTAHANHLIEADFSDLSQDITPSSQSRQDRADAMLGTGLGKLGDPLGILFDRETHPLPVLCRGEQDASDSYTLATAWFRLAKDRVSMDIHHGPDPLPVYQGGFTLS